MDVLSESDRATAMKANLSRSTTLLIREFLFTIFFAVVFNQNTNWKRLCYSERAESGRICMNAWMGWMITFVSPAK